MSLGPDQTGQVEIDDLGSFMPWALQIDSSLRIQWVGPSLQKHGLALAVGDHADQHLQFKRPVVQIPRWDDLVSLDGQLIIWRVNGMEFDLRGAIHVQACGNVLLLVGSPALRKTDDLGSFGITLSDFARHDATPDLLLAVQARDVSIRQAVEATTNLEDDALLRQSILDSAMDAMITIDMEGLVVEFNNAAVKLFGFARVDSIGTPISELIVPPEMREAHEQGLRHYRRTGKGTTLGKLLRFPALCADGAIIQIEMRLVPFKHREDEYFTASIRDLTKQNQDAADLEAGALLRQSILDSAMDAMITIDMEGLVVEFNNAAVNMFGFARADVLGKSISELIVPQEMREDHEFSLLRYRQTGEVADLGQRIESPALRADGTIFPIEMAIIPFSHQQDGYFTASIRDLTKQQQAAAAIERGVEQERLLQRELDHRVKNMLAHLVMLCRRAATDADASEDGSAIASLAHRVESMSQIHDLLMGDSRSGLDTHQLVEVCIRPYQTASGSVMINGAKLRLRDKAAITLTMVFNELAVNASKYGALHHEGGAVKIAWDIQSDDEGASSMVISWEEMHDGPAPQSLDGGLGTEIIRAAIGYELGGTVTLEPTPQGILFLATIPVAQALLDEPE
jgi:PAS domain S-box-containing protein